MRTVFKQWSTFICGPRFLLTAVVLTIFSLQPGAVMAAETAPFKTLLGSWGGGGTAQMSDGRKERINCTAYYTGGGSQLRLAIYCKSSAQNIQMRGKLSYSGGKVSGSWEERTYNAEGSLAGSARNNRINVRISGYKGNLSGRMSVSYSGRRQKVAISTGGIGLKKVNINLSRR